MAKVKRNWFSRLSFAAAALTVSALLVISYVSVFINPERGWFFSLFGMLYMLFAFATLLFFLWALRLRSRMWLFLLIILLPAFHLAGRHIQLRRAKSEEGAIKIVSYNVGLFGKFDIPKAETADSIAAFLMSLDADVICLQEVHLYNQTPTESWLESSFPGYQAEYYFNTDNFGKSGNLTLSRYPVSGKGKFTFENSSNMAIYTDIVFPNGTYRLYNCHFESYSISIPHLLTNVREEEELKDTGRKMRRSIRLRPSQVNMVLMDIESSDHKAIVLGDFNDTPLSYTYHRLSKGRKDSFVTAGDGFGSSFRDFWPLLRIDYILLPDGLKAISHKTLKKPYSDHYPIIVTCDES